MLNLVSTYWSPEKSDTVIVSCSSVGEVLQLTLPHCRRSVTPPLSARSRAGGISDTAACHGSPPLTDAAHRNLRRVGAHATLTHPFVLADVINSMTDTAFEHPGQEKSLRQHFDRDRPFGRHSRRIFVGPEPVLFSCPPRSPDAGTQLCARVSR